MTKKNGSIGAVFAFFDEFEIRTIKDLVTTNVFLDEKNKLFEFSKIDSKGNRLTKSFTYESYDIFQALLHLVDPRLSLGVYLVKGKLFPIPQGNIIQKTIRVVKDAFTHQPIFQTPLTNGYLNYPNPDPNPIRVPIVTRELAAHPILTSSYDAQNSTIPFYLRNPNTSFQDFPTTVTEPGIVIPIQEPPVPNPGFVSHHPQESHEERMQKARESVERNVLDLNYIFEIFQLAMEGNPFSLKAITLMTETFPVDHLVDTFEKVWTQDADDHAGIMFALALVIAAQKANLTPEIIGELVQMVDMWRETSMSEGFYNEQYEKGMEFLYVNLYQAAKLHGMIEEESNEGLAHPGAYVEPITPQDFQHFDPSEFPGTINPILNNFGPAFLLGDLIENSEKNNQVPFFLRPNLVSQHVVETPEQRLEKAHQSIRNNVLDLNYIFEIFQIAGKTDEEGSKARFLLIKDFPIDKFLSVIKSMWKPDNKEHANILYMLGLIIRHTVQFLSTSKIYEIQEFVESLEYYAVQDQKIDYEYANAVSFILQTLVEAHEKMNGMYEPYLTEAGDPLVNSYENPNKEEEKYIVPNQSPFFPYYLNNDGREKVGAVTDLRDQKNSSEIPFYIRAPQKIKSNPFFNPVSLIAPGERDDDGSLRGGDEGWLNRYKYEIDHRKDDTSVINLLDLLFQTNIENRQKICRLAHNTNNGIAQKLALDMIGLYNKVNPESRIICPNLPDIYSILETELKDFKKFGKDQAAVDTIASKFGIKTVSDLINLNVTPSQDSIAVYISSEDKSIPAMKIWRSTFDEINEVLKNIHPDLEWQIDEFSQNAIEKLMKDGKYSDPKFEDTKKIHDLMCQIVKSGSSTQLKFQAGVYLQTRGWSCGKDAELPKISEDFFSYYAALANATDSKQQTEVYNQAFTHLKGPERSYFMTESQKLHPMNSFGSSTSTIQSFYPLTNLSNESQNSEMSQEDFSQPAIEKLLMAGNTTDPRYKNANIRKAICDIAANGSNEFLKMKAEVFLQERGWNCADFNGKDFKFKKVSKNFFNLHAVLVGASHSNDYHEKVLAVHRILLDQDLTKAEKEFFTQEISVLLNVRDISDEKFSLEELTQIFQAESLQDSSLLDIRAKIALCEYLHSGQFSGIVSDRVNVWISTRGGCDGAGSDRKLNDTVRNLVHDWQLALEESDPIEQHRVLEQIKKANVDEYQTIFILRALLAASAKYIVLAAHKVPVVFVKLDRKQDLLRLYTETIHVQARGGESFLHQPTNQLLKTNDFSNLSREQWLLKLPKTNQISQLQRVFDNNIENVQKLCSFLASSNEYERERASELIEALNKVRDDENQIKCDSYLPSISNILDRNIKEIDFKGIFKSNDKSKKEFLTFVQKFKISTIRELVQWSPIYTKKDATGVKLQFRSNSIRLDRSIYNGIVNALSKIDGRIEFGMYVDDGISRTRLSSPVPQPSIAQNGPQTVPYDVTTTSTTDFPYQYLFQRTHVDGFRPGEDVDDYEAYAFQLLHTEHGRKMICEKAYYSKDYSTRWMAKMLLSMYNDDHTENPVDCSKYVPGISQTIKDLFLPTDAFGKRVSEILAFYGFTTVAELLHLDLAEFHYLGSEAPEVIDEKRPTFLLMRETEDTEYELQSNIIFKIREALKKKNSRLQFATSGVDHSDHKTQYYASYSDAPYIRQYTHQSSMPFITRFNYMYLQNPITNLVKPWELSNTQATTSFDPPYYSLGDGISNSSKKRKDVDSDRMKTAPYKSFGHRSDGSKDPASLNHNQYAVGDVVQPWIPDQTQIGTKFQPPYYSLANPIYGSTESSTVNSFERLEQILNQGDITNSELPNLLNKNDLCRIRYTTNNIVALSFVTKLLRQNNWSCSDSPWQKLADIIKEKSHFTKKAYLQKINKFISDELPTMDQGNGKTVVLNYKATNQSAPILEKVIDEVFTYLGDENQNVRELAIKIVGDANSYFPKAAVVKNLLVYLERAESDIDTLGSVLELIYTNRDIISKSNGNKIRTFLQNLNKLVRNEPLRTIIVRGIDFFAPRQHRLHLSGDLLKNLREEVSQNDSVLDLENILNQDDAYKLDLSQQYDLADICDVLYTSSSDRVRSNASAYLVRNKLECSNAWQMLDKLVEAEASSDVSRQLELLNEFNEELTSFLVNYIDHHLDMSVDEDRFLSVSLLYLIRIAEQSKDVVKMQAMETVPLDTQISSLLQDNQKIETRTDAYLSIRHSTYEELKTRFDHRNDDQSGFPLIYSSFGIQNTVPAIPPYLSRQPNPSFFTQPIYFGLPFGTFAPDLEKSIIPYESPENLKRQLSEFLNNGTDFVLDIKYLNAICELASETNIDISLRIKAKQWLEKNPNIECDSKNGKNYSWTSGTVVDLNNGFDLHYGDGGYAGTFLVWSELKRGEKNQNSSNVVYKFGYATPTTHKIIPIAPGKTPPGFSDQDIFDLNPNSGAATITLNRNGQFYRFSIPARRSTEVGQPAVRVKPNYQSIANVAFTELLPGQVVRPSKNSPTLNHDSTQYGAVARASEDHRFGLYYDKGKYVGDVFVKKDGLRFALGWTSATSPVIYNVTNGQLPPGFLPSDRVEFNRIQGNGKITLHRGGSTVVFLLPNYESDMYAQPAPIVKKEFILGTVTSVIKNQKVSVYNESTHTSSENTEWYYRLYDQNERQIGIARVTERNGQYGYELSLPTLGNYVNGFQDIEHGHGKFDELHRTNGLFDASAELNLYIPGSGLPSSIFPERQFLRFIFPSVKVVDIDPTIKAFLTKDKFVGVEIQRVLTELKSPDVRIRKLAAQALKKCKLDRVQIEDLIRAISDENDDVGQAAAESFLSRGISDLVASRAILILASGTVQGRGRFIRVARQPRLNPGFQKIMIGLTNTGFDNTTRTNATNAFVTIIPTKSEFVLKIISLLGDRNVSVANYAELTLELVFRTKPGNDNIITPIKDIANSHSGDYAKRLLRKWDLAYN